jgi:hypothetical protein
MEDINKGIVKETADKLLALCEDDPGAYKCMLELLSSNRRIDPSNGFGPLGSIVTLHSSNISGNNIHLLFDKICKSNVARMIALLRAVQLGFLCKKELLLATHEESSIDVRSIYQKVKQCLALNFDMENEARFT